MNDLDNLSLDLQYLEDYIDDELRDEHPRTYTALNEIRQFVKLMQGNILDILDDEIFRKEYSAIQMHKLSKILKKINDKKKNKDIKKLLKALK